MRVVFAIDVKARFAHTDNLPNCLLWAKDRAQATGDPIKIVVCRGGEKNGRTIAEVTRDGIRPIESGALWSRGKLEFLHGQE